MDKSKSNIRIKVIGIIIFSAIVITLTLTFAYLELIPDNSKKTNISGTTADKLKLTYTDCANTNQEDCANISKNLNVGESVIKTFQIKNEASTNLNYNLYFNQLQNSFKNEELVYKIENIDTGEILIDTSPVPYHKFPVADITIKENIPIEKETTHNYKMTITFLNTDYMQTENMNAIYSIKLSMLKKGNPDYNKIASTDEGIYAMEDDYGISYYYRGAVENNYVKFGKWAEIEENGDKAGKDMHWRIIRVNGDQSLRIIYDGTKPYAIGESNIDRFIAINKHWNYARDDNKYVGWMFGGTEGTASTSYEEAVSNDSDSDIKEFLDSWYEKNLLNDYSKYLSDSIFCNDRTAPGKDVSLNTNDTGLGFGLVDQQEMAFLHHLNLK